METLTHVRSEDVGVTTMQNLAFEVRGEGPEAIPIILQCDIAVSGERSWLRVPKISRCQRLGNILILLAH